MLFGFKITKISVIERRILNMYTQILQQNRTYTYQSVYTEKYYGSPLRELESQGIISRLMYINIIQNRIHEFFV